MHSILSAIWNFHPGPGSGAVVALIVSAAVRALQQPKPGGSAFYLWFYGFAQLLLANFDKSTISISATPVASSGAPALSPTPAAVPATPAVSGGAKANGAS